MILPSIWIGRLRVITHHIRKSNSEYYYTTLPYKRWNISNWFQTNTSKIDTSDKSKHKGRHKHGTGHVDFAHQSHACTCKLVIIILNLIGTNWRFCLLHFLHWLYLFTTSDGAREQLIKKAVKYEKLFQLF
jgi:hypothetical protein